MQATHDVEQIYVQVPVNTLDRRLSGPRFSFTKRAEFAGRCMGRVRVFCLAKGDRDDVQPILVLAKALSNRKQVDTHFCTHRHHKVFISKLEIALAQHAARVIDCGSPCKRFDAIFRDIADVLCLSSGLGHRVTDRHKSPNFLAESPFQSKMSGNAVQHRIPCCLLDPQYPMARLWKV